MNEVELGEKNVLRSGNNNKIIDQYHHYHHHHRTARYKNITKIQNKSLIDHLANLPHSTCLGCFR